MQHAGPNTKCMEHSGRKTSREWAWSRDDVKLIWRDVRQE